jgi:hypothetical protein
MITFLQRHKVLYVTEKCGERAKQRRDREGERERDRGLLQMGYSVGNKLNLEKIFMTAREG